MFSLFTFIIIMLISVTVSSRNKGEMILNDQVWETPMKLRIWYADCDKRMS